MDNVGFVSPNLDKHPKSTIRQIIDAGEGPPRCDVGDSVLLTSSDSSSDDDGSAKLKARKIAREENAKAAWKALITSIVAKITNLPVRLLPTSILSEILSFAPKSSSTVSPKPPSPKLPFGTVTAVKDWRGSPAMARTVLWNATGVEKTYRFGGERAKRANEPFKTITYTHVWPPFVRHRVHF